MSYRNLLLGTLLVPRLGFLEIPGVNSDLRLDVLILLATSLLPLFKKIPIKVYVIVLGILFITSLQLIVFQGNVLRAFFGTGLLISIIVFSQYSNFLSQKAMLSIMKWFLIINIFLHVSDLFYSVSDVKDFSGKYGIFNQHFAFSSAITICYFFLLVNKKATTFLTILFLLGILFSGSRGLQAGLIFSFIFYRFFSFKYFFRTSLVIIFSYFLYIALNYFFPENPYLVRFNLVIDLAIQSSSDIAAILSDPAFNVRLENFYQYIDFFSYTDFPIFYLIFGGGPYNFLDYSMQYGKPGHFDVLYLRILSEYGIIGMIILISVLTYFVRKIDNVNYTIMLSALLIGGIVSEALITAKVAHLFFLTSFYLAAKPNEKSI